MSKMKRFAAENKQLLIDPPQGWRYGFPKPIDLTRIHNRQHLVDFLIDNGYPKGMCQEEILSHCRYFESSKDDGSF